MWFLYFDEYNFYKYDIDNNNTSELSHISKILKPSDFKQLFFMEYNDRIIVLTRDYILHNFGISSDMNYSVLDTIQIKFITIGSSYIFILSEDDRLLYIRNHEFSLGEYSFEILCVMPNITTIDSCDIRFSFLSDGYLNLLE